MPNDSAELFIRNYQSGDWDAVYDICVRTGDRGGDASLVMAGPGLVPDIFAGPYLYLEPEMAFVLDDGTRPVGYVIGTADTQEFVSGYAEHWLPRLVGKYAAAPEPPLADRDKLFLYLLHNPQRMLVPEVIAGYPAHLHIDILPPHQGKGFGRRLIERFSGAAAQAGAIGVHVGVDRLNTGGLAFYPRVGFTPVEVRDADVVYLGRPLSG